MTLIEVINIENQEVKFYKGVDFDTLINHPKDGKDGFIFCFIGNYNREIKKHERQSKIDSLVDGSNYRKFDWKLIENDFISIYQTDGVEEEVVYNTIKNKVLKNQFPNIPWIPISGISKGAWKIV